MKNHNIMKEHCLNKVEQALEIYDPYPDQARYASEEELLAEHPDRIGATIHPWFEDLAKLVGLPDGMGEYWYYGPNRTVDPIIITEEIEPHILLIQRSDNLLWALPGGFIDKGDSIEKTGKKETEEEAGILLPEDSLLQLYDGPVADSRTTAHAWSHTIALLYRIPERVTLTPGEEVEDARWYTLDTIPDPLHGSHAKLIELALQEL